MHTLHWFTSSALNQITFQVHNTYFSSTVFLQSPHVVLSLSYLPLLHQLYHYYPAISHPICSLLHFSLFPNSWLISYDSLTLFAFLQRLPLYLLISCFPRNLVIPHLSISTNLVTSSSLCFGNSYWSFSHLPNKCE